MGTPHRFRELIPLFKYELCFVLGSDGGLRNEIIEADGFEDDYMGEGEHSVPSVNFEREVPDPDDAEETTTLTVFAVPAHRIVYIKYLGEVETVEVGGPDVVTPDGVFTPKADDNVAEDALI